MSSPGPAIPPAKILIVDDDPATHLALVAVLEPLGHVILNAGSGHEALHHLLENDFAVILLDVRLPDMDGFDLAGLIRQRARSEHTPIMFVTGFKEEEYLDKGYHAGGVDILFKPVIPEVLRSKVSVFLELHRKSALVEAHAAELQRLNADLEQRVEQRTAELRQALDALWEASERLRLHFENSPLGIVEWDPEFRVLSWNKEASRIFGWTADEVIGRRLHEFRWVHEEDAPAVQQMLSDMAGGRRLRNVGVNRNYRKDGSIVDCEWYTSALLDSSRKLKSVLSFALNVTERRRAEEEIRQAQRLESLGVLAGGVAHDFNNLLTGILGTASLVLDDLPQGDKNRPVLEALLEAGQSAAHLTAQLLAYAGKGQFTLGPVYVSEVVREVADLVRHSIPETVKLQLDLDDHVPPVETDIGQISQLVMNLIMNGAEAVPEDRKGIVRVRTAARDVTPGAGWTGSDGSELPHGSYVCLEVIDNGSGIEKWVLDRIFEPFFTTKFLGRGLGLAAVHGIIRKNRGGIRIDTDLGNGSTFTVLLPAMEASASPKTLTASPDSS